MSRGITPPTNRSTSSDLKRRLTDVERKLDRSGANVTDQGQPFTLAGSIYTSNSSPWTPYTSVELVRIITMLGTAGSTTTTVTVSINGDVYQTINLESGIDMAKNSMSRVLVPDEDIVVVACTAAGTDAEDLSVILQYI